MSASPAPAKAVTDVLDILCTADAGIMQAATARLALLPTSPLKTHRVQLSVRGRRFETSMEVATSYCLAFYLFFGLPINTAALRAHLATDALVSHTVTNFLSEWLARLEARAAQQEDGADFTDAYVSDVVQERFVPTLARTDSVEETDVSILSALLRAHFIATVVPALETLEAALITSTTDSADKHTPTTTTPSTEATVVDAPVLPALPVPEQIEYDGVSLQWRFNFPKKLSSDAEERERARLQRLAILAQQSLAACGAAAAGGLDPNGNPFLLLQPDYVGVLLVYLRRVEKARQDPTGSTRQPEFPVRWHELGYDEQVSLTQILRAFGVVPLLLTGLARPSADPETTSMYRSSHPERVMAQGALEDAAAGGSLRARAQQFLHETGQTEVAPVVDARAYTHPSVEDDLLTLMPQGCSTCGMSGHTAADCPHK